MPTRAHACHAPSTWMRADPFVPSGWLAAPRLAPATRSTLCRLCQLLDAYVNNEYFNAEVVRRSAAAAAHLAEWVVGCQRCAALGTHSRSRSSAAVPLPTLVPLVHFVPEGLLAVRAHPASARSWMDVDSVARVRSNLQRTHTCVVAYSGDSHLRSSL